MDYFGILDLEEKENLSWPQISAKRDLCIDLFIFDIAKSIVYKEFANDLKFYEIKDLIKHNYKDFIDKKLKNLESEVLDKILEDSNDKIMISL